MMNNLAPKIRESDFVTTTEEKFALAQTTDTRKKSHYDQPRRPEDELPDPKWLKFLAILAIGLASYWITDSIHLIFT